MEMQAEAAAGGPGGPDLRSDLPVVSFNQACEYFIDSLTGRSQQTRDAYYMDLLQFKLYLVRYRRHLIRRGDPERIERLEEELAKARGKLLDTRYTQRRHRLEVRSRAILDEFDLDLSQLTKEDIVGYFGYLESGKSLSRATLLRRLASLRRFIGLLVKEKYPVPAEVLEKLNDMDIRRERRLPIALEREEAQDFLRVVSKDPRDYAIVLVMLYMGLRISEVVRLNEDDFGPGTQGISFQGKGGKERYVPVHPVVLDAILKYKEVRPDAERDALGVPLFVSRHRRRIDPSTVRKLIKRYAKEALALDNQKRKKLSPHKLRHTFATLLLQGDVDIRYIQELLGHENLSTTEIYTTVRKADLERAIDRHPLGLEPAEPAAESRSPSR